MKDTKKGWLGLVDCCYRTAGEQNPRPALRDRSAAFQAQPHQSRVGGQGQRLEGVDFSNALTGPELLEKAGALLPEHRERLYPPTVAVAMFVKQARSEDRSSQRAVNGWIAQCVAEGLKPPALRNIGADLSERALEKVWCEYPVELMHGFARRLLADVHYQARELVYCNPPYLHSTRSSERRCRFEY